MQSQFPRFRAFPHDGFDNLRLIPMPDRFADFGHLAMKICLQARDEFGQITYIANASVSDVHANVIIPLSRDKFGLITYDR